MNIDNYATVVCLAKHNSLSPFNKKTYSAQKLFLNLQEYLTEHRGSGYCHSNLDNIRFVSFAEFL